MLTLQDILDAFADGGADAVIALFAAQDAPAIGDLRGAAGDAFQALYSAENRTPDDVAQMAVIADVIDLLRAEEDSRAELALAAAAEADALLARALGTPDVVDAAVDAPADAPAAEPLTGEIVDPAPAPAPRRRVDLASLANRAPAPVTPPVVTEPEPGARLIAASDVPGIPAGSVLDIPGVASAALARYAGLPTTQVDNAHIKHQFALVQKHFPDHRILTGVNDDAVLEAVGDETLLEGGSLLAAGGWCAPSEVWYDLCPGLESGAGMVSLPSVLASRGGVRWTPGPQFCDFYSGTGFFDMTEAQDIAGFDKPCFEIPCPEFDECRLTAHGLCLTAGILQNRGYPEFVARFISGSLAAHAHRINQLKIADMVAQSVAVTPVTGSPAVGATMSVLDAIELYVTNYRYQFRMDPSRTLEGVFPFWLHGVIRSDLGKRNGVDMIDVSDADISRWFTSRGVAAQFVYDWQDAQCATTAPGNALIGGDFASVTAWPDEVQFLLYAAGTFVSLESDIITLEAVYDSVLFRRNRYTALFTEEAFCIIKRCYESLVVTVDICANGSTSAQATPACPVA